MRWTADHDSSDTNWTGISAAQIKDATTGSTRKPYYLKMNCGSTGMEMNLRCRIANSSASLSFSSPNLC